VDYRNKPGVLRDVALEIQPGEILGLVGQSGSGKSTLSLAILRLLHLKGGTARGDLFFKGEDLSAKTEAQMRSLRGREISIVLQSPLSSLNPALRIGSQLSEASPMTLTFSAAAPGNSASARPSASSSPWLSFTAPAC
jgi:ABC-type glutathione transport system ATPase component